MFTVSRNKSNMKKTNSNKNSNCIVPNQMAKPKAYIHQTNGKQLSYY